MTDKKIKKYCDGLDCSWCNEKEPCIYRRANELEEELSAKEQECEKIKNWVKGMMFDTDCSNWFEHFTTAFEDWKNYLISQLDQLKAERKILDEEDVVVEITVEQFEEYKKLKAENETKQKALELQKSWLDNLEFQRTNLKQALQEIKKIIKRCIKRIPLFEMKAIANDINEILNKISEVEDGNKIL